MSISEIMQMTKDEEIANNEKQRKKCGSYTLDRCPNCGRSRVMLGVDNKRRCEKCSWCIEDNEYDLKLSEYLLS
jgi:hypothetical protein